MKFTMNKQQHNSLKVFATAALLLSSTGMLMNPIAVTASQKPAIDPASIFGKPNIEADKWYKQGETKYQEGDDQGAIAAFTEAIKLQPSRGGAYYLRGIVKHRFGDDQGAIADYNKVLEMSGPSSQADALQERGKSYYMLGDTKLALADYQKAADYYQAEKLSYYTEEALKQVKKIQLEIATQSKMTAEEWYKKANDSSSSEAMGYLNRAIKLKPNYAEAYLSRCDRLQSRKNHQRAIADCSQAIKLDPKLEAAYRSLSYAHEENNDLRSAIAAYTQLIKIAKPDPNNYYNRAELHVQVNDTQGVIADLQQAADLYKKKGELEEYELYMELIKDCKPNSCNIELPLF